MIAVEREQCGNMPEREGNVFRAAAAESGVAIAKQSNEATTEVLRA